MLLTILVAVAVPFTFLYLLHWLDLYGSDRPRIVLLCVAWGPAAFALSFIVNRYCIDIVGLSRKFVSTRTAPFVEEVFKAGVLLYLVHRGRLTYFVDGAIYGFASGMGFAAIENLRYIQLFPDHPFDLVLLRDFSSALAHGTATALTGIALGCYALALRRKRQIAPAILGLAGAMTLHYLWNNFGYYSPLPRNETEWVLVGVGLAGVALVAATILWGMHQERRQLHQSLGMALGVSEEEATIVQHMDDLDHLLAPIEQRFGKVKRRHVAEFLHLEAQLGLSQERAAKALDPQTRAALEHDIAVLERRLDARRRDAGVYVMLYVRSIFQQTSWSLWARLARTLMNTPPAGNGMGEMLAARGAIAARQADDIYARANRVIGARAGAAPALRPIHELPEPMQRCMQWVMKEVQATAEHVAAGLGHQETHARELLHELVARGYLHRATRNGQEAFRARRVASGEHPVGMQLWHGLAQRLARRNSGGS